jgi:anti-sigma-K factor RskA
VARELSRRELDELLGAYALDAVDDDERAQLEAYLERSPEARALVAEYRETAALLSHSGTEAPPGLWERIQHTLEEEPPRLAVPSPARVGALGSHGARRRGRVAAAIGVAAAVVAVGAFTVKVVQQDDRIDELSRQAETGSVLAAAEAASRDPRAARVTMSSTDGALEARVVYLPDGDGFLVQDNLGALAPERTYQLWALMGDAPAARPISAGVLGSDPGVAAFRVQGPVTAFAITDERAPGVDAPGNPPLLQGAVR